MYSPSIEIKLASIRANVSIFALLDKFDIEYPHGQVTQQVSCPFHTDRRPSARVYSDTNKVYCFTCNKTWDQISLVREKLRLNGLPSLVDWFEQNFKLPSATENLRLAIQSQLEATTTPSLADLYTFVEAQLVQARHKMTLDQYVARLYALDVIAYKYSKHEMQLDRCQMLLKELLVRIQNS